MPNRLSVLLVETEKEKNRLEGLMPSFRGAGATGAWSTEGEQGITAAPEPSGIVRFLESLQEKIRQKTGYFEPPIYGEPIVRIEHPAKTGLGIAGFYGAKFLSGLGLNLPDIIANKISAAESLAEAVNKITGFTPTAEEIQAAEQTEFIGGLATAGGITGKLVKGIAARQALKTILQAGVTFAGRKTAEEIADKFTTNEPIDIEGIHFEGGLGVLFGVGEVGVSRLASFIRNLRTLPEPTKASLKKEAIDTLNEMRRTGDRTKWDALREKYAGLSPEVARKYQPPLPVREFGKYPLGKPVVTKATPTIAGKPPVEVLEARRAAEPTVTAPPTGIEAVKPVEKAIYTSKPGFAALPEFLQGREGLGLKLYQDIFNRFAAIEDVTKRARTLGMKIQPGEDAGKRARGYLGIAGKAQSVLEDKTFRITPEGKIEITGEGLKPILNDYESQGKVLGKTEGVLKTNFKEYLKATRTIEDLQRPPYEGAERQIVTPKQVEEATNTLDKLNGQYGEKISILQGTAKRIYDYQSRTLHLLVDSGNLSEEQYQQILKLNQHYIPFDRVMEDIEPGGVSPVSKRRFTGARAPVKRIKGSEREIYDPIESVVKNTYRILDASERNTVARNVAKLGEVLPEEISAVKIKMAPVAEVEGKIVFRPSQFKPKGNVIEYFENGKRKYIEVSPELYQAMSGMNEVSSSLLIDLFATPAQWLRKGATITPEFITRNPMRDQWTAFMQTNVGFIPFVDTARGISDIVGKSDVYYDYLRSGAAQSGFVEMTRPALQKAVKELNKHPDLIKRLNILTDVQDLSQLMERGTRVGVYRAAVRKGVTPVEAGFVSRESTLDFARRGAKTRDVNKVIAFFNAGMQGLDTTARTFAKRPVTTTIKGALAITIPSLLLYLKNRQDPEYAEIPRWQRDLFWVTKVGDTYIRIPKPFLYGQIFGSIPERFFEYLDTKDKSAFDKLAKSTYESLSPVTGDPAGGLIPTALKPIVENAANWNFFLGRPIISEGKERLMPEEQYGRYTSETAKMLGRTLGYSPAKIENLARGWFGGTAQYALDASDYLVNEIRKESGEKIPQKPKYLERAPLIRGFTIQPPSESGQAESIERFYDKGNEIISAYNTLKKLIAEGKDNQAKSIIRKYPIEMAPLFSRALTEMSDWNKGVDTVLKDTTLTGDQKKELLKRFEQKRIEIGKTMNDLMKKVG